MDERFSGLHGERFMFEQTELRVRQLAIRNFDVGMGLMKMHNLGMEIGDPQDITDGLNFWVMFLVENPNIGFIVSEDQSIQAVEIDVGQSTDR